MRNPKKKCYNHLKSQSSLILAKSNSLLNILGMASYPSKYLIRQKPCCNSMHARACVCVCVCVCV